MKMEAQTKVELRRQDYNENRPLSPRKLIKMGASSLSWNLNFAGVTINGDRSSLWVKEGLRIRMGGAMWRI